MDGDSTQSAVPAFKVADHQVAGHRFEDGRVGSLVDDSGRFYKPLQNGSRGDNEVHFYERLWADKSIPPSVQKFFPKFYGTIGIDAPDGSGPIRHAIMEDLTHGFKHPGIMDVKIGFRTWYPEAGEKYVAKCMAKDKETTSEALGIRISGMQVYDTKNETIWRAPKKWCKFMTPEVVPEALKRFVSSNPADETGSDGALAEAVYGAALVQLEELKAWFEKQVSYHFFSASVLLVYEGEPKAERVVSARLVDFAHVLYDQSAVDENFLSGLNVLIQMLSDVIKSVKA